MGVQIDLIVPPIIVGLLIILIFNVNSFILETSVDNRLTNDMQTFADVSVDVVQEEIRGLRELNYGGISDSTFTFVNIQQDTVSIWADRGALKFRKHGLTTSPADTAIYPGYLKSINFNLEPENVVNPNFLRVKITTESRPEHHARVSSKNDENTVVRAFSEKQIYLRNLDLQQ